MTISEHNGANGTEQKAATGLTSQIKPVAEPEDLNDIVSQGGFKEETIKIKAGAHEATDLNNKGNMQNLKSIPFEEEPQEQSKEPCLLDGFANSLVTSTQLQQMDLPKRKSILGNWFLEGDLGFVFGSRGLGKTWLSLHLAKCISEGSKCGKWECEIPRKVMYIDGEMPVDGMKDRDTSLSNEESENLLYLTHEIYFQKTGKVFSLNDKLQQEAILKLCIKQGVKVLFMDNLSCLFSGMDENNGDHWEKVLPWLLNLRRHKISVVIVHHSGKRGDTMRGTSRREDAAFWVIKLSNPTNDKTGSGAHFISRFTKDRNSSNNEETIPFEWSFEPRKDSKTSITCKDADDINLFKQLVRDGVTSCTEIAEELGCTKGKVSKLAKKGIQAGWLTKDNRDYKYEEK